MSDLKVTIPVTFALALALSAASSNAGVASIGDTSELLKPGRLRTLLDENGEIISDKTDAAREDQSLKRRMAQCWQGYWRRC
jgi:hypothetical protein